MEIDDIAERIAFVLVVAVTSVQLYREVSSEVVESAVEDQPSVETVVLASGLVSRHILVDFNVVCDFLHLLERVVHSLLQIRVVVECGILTCGVRAGIAH